MRHPVIEMTDAAPCARTPSSPKWPSASGCVGDACDTDRSGRPLHPDDVTPLQWWRTMPADVLGDAQHLLLLSTLEKIDLLNNPARHTALRGDAAARIRIAYHALPIGEITFDIDLTMSSLMASALGGNAAAAVVLSHILHLTPLDRPFGHELSVSWLVLNLRRALSAKAIAARYGSTGKQQPIDHRTAFYAGDFS